MTDPQKELRGALRNLRHLYEQMIAGHVRATPEDIKRAAEGLLAPTICVVERIADNLAPEEDE